jgi:hypothetical protein
VSAHRPSRHAYFAECMVLVDALHEAGFRTILIESNQLSEEDPGYALVWLTQVELDHTYMTSLINIANEFGAKISLERPNHNQIPRLKLWPLVES